MRAAIQAGPIENPVNGHTYYLLSPASWTAAQAEAVGLGGHLVTVVDDAENTWLWETFSALGAPPFWIGLNDEAQEGTFVWVSGRPVTYLNWWTAGGQPSNDGGVEHYTEMNNYLWNDNIESRSFRGIAEVVPSGILSVQVDWNADVSGSQGTGTLSGSFGVFDVSAEGETFGLPMDSSLIVTASGFLSGFANIDYPLNYGGGGLAIRFDSLDPIATTLVGDPGQMFPFLASTPLVSCGAPEVCRAIIQRNVAAGTTLALAGRGPFENQTYTEYTSSGTPSLSYSLVPEPGATGAWLTLAALAALRRRSCRRARRSAGATRSSPPR